MNTTFLSAALQNMDERLVKACALWSALRICEHELPGYKFEVAVELAIEALVSGQPASDYMLDAAMHESCPSGVRSAIFSLNTANYRLQAEHALCELAKQQGLHFVNAMLADLFETNTSPLEVAA